MFESPSADSARDWAESGIACLTGRPGGPPLIPPGRAATIARGMAARIEAATNGTVRLDGARLLSERAAFTGHRRAGAVSAGGSCRLLRTADGWAAVSCARPDDPLLLGALVGADVGEDPWPAVTSWLADHTGQDLLELAEPLGIAAGPVSPVPAEAPQPLVPRTVDGLLVVDFSSLWAGPLCSHILGLAGARVVKVETPTRPDGARLGNADFYRLLHGGHESVVLDPGDDTERRELAQLVTAADIIIEASRPRALAGFGLDADRFVASGGTWVSITAHGRDSFRIGFGDDIAASAGLIAYDAQGPVFVGDALADPLTGLTAAALALSAPADGSGVLWDVSMSAVVSSTLTHHLDDSERMYRSSPPLDAMCHSLRGRWWVEAPSGTVALAEPERREPAGDVAESGRDTSKILSELGIR
ncbi:CoA transferase family III [Rhodococcus sp. SMB37]|uniref:CoA transferase n=1 Tax=Rhodococcus sp. SMB37 TaxID=2512213 RepID=UPI0010EDE084|nr:CoA transferase [Rhodococcus sp. SMB37]TCN50101.1 CoA transferase family III [Rhodococcus sp. SMB37]